MIHRRTTPEIITSDAQEFFFFFDIPTGLTEFHRSVGANLRNKISSFPYQKLRIFLS